MLSVDLKETVHQVNVFLLLDISIVILLSVGWACATTQSTSNTTISLAALKDRLTARAANMSEPLNWMESVRDLSKLLGLDHREHNFIQLAQKLGYKGDVKDSYHLHVWLHHQLLETLKNNGGDLPSYLYES